MGGDELTALVEALAARGGATATRAFEQVGRGPTALRDRVAAIVKAFAASDPIADLLGEPEAPSRWPEYARCLGVAP
jgi:hypothetical protein